MTRRADHAANLEFVLGEKASMPRGFCGDTFRMNAPLAQGFLGLEFDDRDAFATNPLWEM